MSFTAAFLRPRESKPVGGGSAWTFLVGTIDAMLRRHYGIYEFTDDPSCLFRIGLAAAPAAVRLSDGTEVAAGDPIGVLHFWNEHIPPFPPRGPDLHWAKRAETQVRRSLTALCRHAETNPDWQSVQAIWAAAPVSRGGYAAWQMRQLARRHGFDVLPEQAQARSSLPGLAEGIVIWSLTRAYNPQALRHHRFLRNHEELWLSRAALRARYGPQGEPAREASFREAAE